MRYLYRSYCLKEGGFWLWRWRAQRRKPIKSGQTENPTEKGKLSVWMIDFVESEGKGRAYMDGPIYHWGIYTYWLKSTIRQGAKSGPAYFLAASCASTSSSGFSTCHWAIGLRGLASMSDQWRNSVPELLRPTNTLPMASFLPILS